MNFQFASCLIFNIALNTSWLGITCNVVCTSVACMVSIVADNSIPWVVLINFLSIMHTKGMNHITYHLVNIMYYDGIRLWVSSSGDWLSLNSAAVAQS